jgi:hypothetical protein
MERTRFISLLLLLIALVSSLSPLHLARPQPSAPDDSLRFSHRRHLALAAMDCQDCHFSATISRHASENNLPKPETCLSCHDGIHAMRHENPSAAYVFRRLPKTLHFNHQQHLALGNVAPALAAAVDDARYLGSAAGVREHLETENACEACHRGLRESDVTGQIHYPQMADCLVCHSAIDPPFSCELCHTKEAKIKPASHTRDYIDVHSSRNAKLDKPSCTICHGKGFRCMGCH